MRTRLAWYQARLNGRDWRRFQRSLAAQVERVVVPSDVDAARSGLTNVEVIPNTYPRPRQPAGDPSAARAAGRPVPREPRLPPQHRRGGVVGDRHRSPHPGHRSGDGGTTGRPAGHQRQVAPPARDGDRGGPGPLHGGRAGPGVGRRRAGPLRQWDPGEDPRVLRSPCPGGVHHRGGGGIGRRGRRASAPGRRSRGVCRSHGAPAGRRLGCGCA